LVFAEPSAKIHLEEGSVFRNTLAVLTTRD
jgi:hypothetical protein